MLAALPVLPIQFHGLPLSLGTLFDKPPAVKVQTTAEKIPPHKLETPPVKGDNAACQVQLLESASQDLLAQISQSPVDPALQNRLGLVFLGLGEADKAQDHFERAVELARSALSGLSERGQNLQSQGNMTEASACLVETSRLAVELSAAHSNLARLYEKAGQHDKVLKELDMLNREGVIATPVEKTRPGAVQAHTHELTPVVARLLAKAEALMQSQQLNAAIQEFKNIISMDPDLASAHSQLGVLNALVNNKQGAVEELEKAIKLKPDDAVSQNNLGLTLEEMGKGKQAKEQFEKAIASNPRLVDAAINLGNLLANSESYDAARKVLQQAVVTNPKSAVAHNNLGGVLAFNGDTTQAITEFSRAITLEPNLASAHYGLGVALIKTHSYKDAVQELKQALLLDPKLSGAREKIEQALRKAGTAACATKITT